MNRKHNFKYDIIYGDDKPKIDFDSSLTHEDTFLFYRLTSHLLNDLFWREKNKQDKSKITTKQLNDIGTASHLLDNLANLSGDLLVGFNKNMDGVNEILNNNDDDDV